MNPPVQAVTFDVGGTLIEPWPSVGHVYAEVAARHGERGLDPDALARRFVTAWQEAGPGFDYSREAWTRLVAETLVGVSAIANDAAFFAELYARFARPDPWRVFADVVPALTTLRRLGWRLAVVSNWDERLRPLLRALDLERYFEVIAVSGEVGVHKPNPRIFAWVARALGLPPAALFHVGDSWDADVCGARRAGWRAVGLARAGRPAPPASDWIASLAELPAYAELDPASMEP